MSHVSFSSYVSYLLHFPSLILSYSLLIPFPLSSHTPPLPLLMYRGRILRRDWYKSLKSFTPCYSQSHLITEILPIPFLSKSGLKLVCNENIVYLNLKSEDSQDCPQETSTKLYVREFGFSIAMLAALQYVAPILQGIYSIRKRPTVIFCCRLIWVTPPSPVFCTR